MNPHLADLFARQPELSRNREELERAFELLRGVFRGGGRLLLCGNGGSAADVEHVAGELLKGFARPRPLRGAFAERLGPDAAHLQGALPCIPLTGFLSLRTAWLNDREPDYLYAQLVQALGRNGDALWAVSTSGNAVNVTHALRVARALGLATVGFTGRDGGAMNGLCDALVHAPADETFRIQELHAPIYHTLCRMLEDEFFGP